MCKIQIKVPFGIGKVFLVKLLDMGWGVRSNEVLSGWNATFLYVWFGNAIPIRGANQVF